MAGITAASAEHFQWKKKRKKKEAKKCSSPAINGLVFLEEEFLFCFVSFFLLQTLIVQSEVSTTVLHVSK